MNRDDAVPESVLPEDDRAMTESGHPHHPLYLKRDTVYQPFRR